MAETKRTQRQAEYLPQVVEWMAQIFYWYVDILRADRSDYPWKEHRERVDRKIAAFALMSKIKGLISSLCGANLALARRSNITRR